MLALMVAPGQYVRPRMRLVDTSRPVRKHHRMSAFHPQLPFSGFAGADPSRSSRTQHRLDPFTDRRGRQPGSRLPCVQLPLTTQ